MKLNNSRLLFKPVAAVCLAALAIISISSTCFAEPDPNYIDHDRDRPAPKVVTPALPSRADMVGKAPSDAVVLFDGTSNSKWVSLNDGSPTKWIVRDGYLECVKDSGYVRTLQNFGDCQLHVEWATPNPPHGEGQGRGNSGVFFGFDRYEVQVLDSYNSKTYSDGSAGSIYGQYPPLVNASLPPGEWQTYDIIYTAPRFDSSDKLTSPARVTVFHNGVLIQNNVELTGPTSWINRAPYSAHPVKQPIALQDHGNPVRYRNIWVRELGNPGRPEFTLPEATLDSYAGKYDGGMNVTKSDHRLTLLFAGQTLPLFAEGDNKFFAKSTDVRVEFTKDSEGAIVANVSVGEGMQTRKKL